MKKYAALILSVLVISSCASGGAALNNRLFDAAANGDTRRVAEYLNKGADPAVSDPADKGENPDYGPATALEASIRANSLPCAKLLYDKGARLPKGSEALHSLISSDDPDADLVLFLIADKDLVNVRDLGGDTPLSLAVMKGAEDIAFFLIAKGAVYTDSTGKVLGNKRAIADVRKNAEENPRAFTGSYTGGYLGFEGRGYYFSLKDSNGKSKIFRSGENPEIAYFIISKETGMPAQNKELIGQTFRVYYRRETGLDVRGETVSVNAYIHSDVIER